MKTILLAEDNQGMAVLCQRGLEDEGYKVLLAYDGEEACQTVQKNVPDVVILDISMPRVGGLEALARIKKAYPDVPVILFTGFDDDCVRDGRARLATACVEKSGDLAELKRAIIRALAYGGQSDSFRLGLPD
jgi:two-component system, response regulator, stage 0 sporulation protein F